ncbi:MAG TPA: squalene/phytoene synthase family protein, partial [Casimicrobiaceae bacterium]|nr:squalene/phytoene synthase family protein [Casimicrobiaceae bacterium]
MTDLIGDLLRQVSRSFYLSLAILPRPLREPIGLAYLLARASDTVADTRLLPRVERLGHLHTLRAAYSGAPADVAAVGRACALLQSLEAERELLTRVAEALARVDRLPADDRAAVRGVLSTITDGQVFDLVRFPGEDAGTLAALDTLAELDRYTYLVAGCVGEFWTDMTGAHTRAARGWDLSDMREKGIRFGKALQMTNILRDCAKDLRIGRCY